MAESSTSDWHSEVLAQRPWLQALIGRRLSESAAVEDVLQETLSAGVDKAPEREEVRDLRAWLGGVAQRKAQDHLRKKMRRERVLETMQNELQAAVATPVEVLIAGERHALVKAAVDGLPEQQASLLHLKYAEGKSYAQIGAQLGLDHNAVANGLREARRNLREAMSAEGL